MTEALKANKSKIVVALIAILVIYFVLGNKVGGISIPERTYSGDVIAKVNGQKIKEEEIRERLDFITGGKAASIDLGNIDEAGLKALAKEVYVQREVLAAALKSSVKSDKDFQNRLASLVNTVYKEKYLENIAKKDINEDKIKATYDQLVGKAKGAKQYKVKHALFKTEEEAKAAKAKIDAGSASLEDIAKAESVDKLSAAKGGDLGYIFPDEFVKEFSDAVKNAPKGEVQGPIKTEFGYHLMKVEDSKPAEIVPFDQARPRIEKQLGSDSIRTYVDSISKDLNIEVVKKPTPKADAQPAAGKPAAAPAAPAKDAK